MAKTNRSFNPGWIIHLPAEWILFEAFPKIIYVERVRFWHVFLRPDGMVQIDSRGTRGQRESGRLDLKDDLKLLT
jgi:hypothetical protein